MLNNGYACDACGAELFEYPRFRLCRRCEESLRRTVNPCALCGREGRAEGLCTDCKSAPPAFDKGVSVFVYHGNSAELINRFKKGKARLAAYLGERMAIRFFDEVQPSVPLLVLPVPLTKERRIERGYNQAELLADGVCEQLQALGVRTEKNFTLLEKTRETEMQKHMTKRERRENVRGAYRITERAACKGKTVLLVDDIMTTSSTGNEIAQRLRKAGASAVYLLTAASVPEKE